MKIAFLANLKRYLISILAKEFVIDCEYPYETVTTPGGTIISPNYPNNNYDDNLDCKVTITFGGQVKITFVQFDLEEDDQDPNDLCGYDWIQVYDANTLNPDYTDLISSKLCGKDNPSPITSFGNSMNLLFHSDSSTTSKGFEIKVDQGMMYNVIL